MSEHTEIVDLIPAYALHSLDEEEARRVAAHLETCQSCREALVAYEGTAARLVAYVPLVEPPGHLKGRLMARVRPAPSDAASTGSPLSWWGRVKAGLRSAAPVWAPVSAALILALLIGNLLLWQQVRQSASPEVIALSGTDAAPDANGVLVLTQAQPDGVLFISDLAPLSEEQQYQLWLIAEDGSRDSGAVFSVAADGRAEVGVSGRKALPDYAAFGVTIEPAGGSPGPTGQQVLGSGL